MRDLNTLTTPELEIFFSSFDQVLADMDGVLWNVLHNIPGASDAISSLQKLGKQITTLSNNTTKSIDTYYKQLKEANFNLEKNNIVTPTPVMISYLQKKNFHNKKIFVLGPSVLKEALKEADFVLAENGPDRIEETFLQFGSLFSGDDDSVGAVIVDIDLNLNFLNLHKAASYLQNPDIEFLCGARDEKNTLGKNQNLLIGPGSFIKMLENTTGRKATGMAKRSLYLNEYLMERFQLGKDSSRVLLIGDSIPEDMGFAAQCGYKKLLVLSGMSKMSDIEKWRFPAEFKPDFYVESLKTVHELIYRVFGNEL